MIRKECFKLDELKARWRPFPAMTTARKNTGFVSNGDSFLIVGGVDEQSQELVTGEMIKGSESWTKIADFPEPISGLLLRIYIYYNYNSP